MVYARDSKSRSRKGLWVQVPPMAPGDDRHRWADSKSCTARCEGSIPSFGTIFLFLIHMSMSPVVLKKTSYQAVITAAVLFLLVYLYMVHKWGPSAASYFFREILNPSTYLGLSIGLITLSGVLYSPLTRRQKIMSMCAVVVFVIVYRVIATKVQTAEGFKAGDDFADLTASGTTILSVAFIIIVSFFMTMFLFLHSWFVRCMFKKRTQR